MIIAVDYDDTLKIQGKPNYQLITILRQRQMSGDTVILWTCRRGERLRQAVSFLSKHGFRPNYINENCPQGLQILGYDSRKIYADMYIDDKNMR